MMASGFSWPSTTLVCSDEYTSAKLIDAGRRVEGLEHRRPQRRHRHADLHALEVVGRVDRLGRRRGLAEAVVPDLVHRDQVLLQDLRADPRAELAVHRLPHGVVVGEREADAADLRRGHQLAQDQARQREELDAARAQLAQHVVVGAELVVRIDLDVDAALGLGADRVGHLLGAQVHRVRDRQVVRVLVRELGLLRERAHRWAARGCWRHRRGSGGGKFACRCLRCCR